MGIGSPPVTRMRFSKASRWRGGAHYVLHRILLVINLDLELMPGGTVLLL
jgi:hypothetical protein